MNLRIIPKRAVIAQREVHYDTYSFAAALRSILREDPDVVLIGEMRDLETIQAADGGGDGAIGVRDATYGTRRRSRLTVLLTCFRRINSHRSGRSWRMFSTGNCSQRLRRN